MENKEKIESAILVLEDIKKALESEEPVDSFITHWERAQYVDPDVEKAKIYDIMRACYAENVGFAIDCLKCLEEKP